MQTTSAIILVGGRGTRLGSLTDHTPKPLLPVAGKPFLLHVLDYLIAQGIKSVVLSTGYLASQFATTLGKSYRGVNISYVFESLPLGTGGAIHNAFLTLTTKRAFVLNGDTLFQADLTQLENMHLQNRARISLALRLVPDVARFGHISLSGTRLTEMHEKGSKGEGLINGGTYLIERDTYSSADAPSEHSFEKVTIPRAIADQRAFGLVQNTYFIDIGIPADLEKANRDLA